jgi:hypothetical protein
MNVYFEKSFSDLAFPVALREEANPFSDHFPFNIWGIPSLWATRLNLFDASYWMLHSRHDRMDNISLDVLAKTTESYSDILKDLSGRRNLPFPRSVSADLNERVEKLAAGLYRHPWSPPA